MCKSYVLFFLFRKYLVYYPFATCICKVVLLFHWPLRCWLSKFIIIIIIIIIITTTTTIIMFIKFCSILIGFLRIIFFYFNVFLFCVVSPCVYCLFWIYNNTEYSTYNWTEFQLSTKVCGSNVLRIFERIIYICGNSKRKKFTNKLVTLKTNWARSFAVSLR